MANDFDDYGRSVDGDWFFQHFKRNRSLTPISIIDASNSHIEPLNAEAQIISKDKFADYVAGHPAEFNFENFRKIFSVIVSILTDVQAARGLPAHG